MTAPKDPIAELSDDVHESAGRAIDVLHVAALLESGGYTDERARTAFGVDDAFALALAVRTRVTPTPTPWRSSADDPSEQGSLDQRLRENPTGHGALYALTSLAIAGLLGVVPIGELAGTVIIGGAAGWVWAAITSWLSFQLAGRGLRRRAHTMTLRSAVGVIVAAGVVSGMTYALGAHLPVSPVVIFALIALQVGSTLLFLGGRRAVLLAALVPGSVGGILGLTARRPETIRPLLIGLFALSVSALVIAGLVTLWRDRPSSEPDNSMRVLRSPGLASISAYAVLCALFLLLPQFVLLREGGNQILGMAGLVLVMGLVEWRSLVMSSRARALLRTTSYPEAFRRRYRHLVAREVASVLLAAGVTNALIALVLAQTSHLTRGGVLLLVITAPLAAAYLLLLASSNTGAYRHLNLCLLAGCTLEVVLLGPLQQPVITTFGISVLVVLVLAACVLLTRPLRSFA